MAIATSSETLKPNGRSSLRALLVPAVFLCGYAALLAVGVTHHEPWADEAQAWQLVRSLPLWQLLAHQLHYEGHPGLWFVCIAVLQHLGVSYTGMRWAVAFISLVSTGILLFRSPFPLLARCALALTFFLSFQYAIVAREYSLAPLLFFCLAVSWRRRSAVLPLLLLGLLANLSYQCFAASAGFAVVYAYEIWRRGRRPQYIALAGGLLLTLYVLAILTVMPRPGDVSFPTTSVHVGTFSRLAEWLRQSWAYAVRAVGMRRRFAILIFAWLAWCFRSLRARLYLLPIISICLSAGLYFNFWHLGMLELTCIASAWMAWPMDVRSKIEQVASILIFAGYVSLQVAWAAHAYIYDFSNSYSPGRDAAVYLRPFVERHVPMAVTYVKSILTGDTELSTPDPVGAYPWIALAPYFDKSPFLNEPQAYWDWSTQRHKRADLDAALATRPPIVVAMYLDVAGQPFNPEQDLQRPRMQALTKRGYELRKVFCGAKPEGLEEPERTCALIFFLH